MDEGTIYAGTIARTFDILYPDVYKRQTVGLAWPALMGIVALGMSGYCTVNEAIALSLGSSVVWQVLMFMLLAGGVTSCGLGEYIARWIISRPFLKGRPILFVFMFFMGF